MKTEIKNELEELKSGLANLDNSKIYSPPEGYFDSMQKSVLDTIDIERRKANKVVKLRWMMGIAASLVLILGVVFAMQFQTPKQDALSKEEIYEYLEENIESFDEESLTNLNTEIYTDFESESYPDNEILNDYLNESIDDLTEEDIEQIF